MKLFSIHPVHAVASSIVKFIEMYEELWLPANRNEKSF